MTLKSRLSRLQEQAGKHPVTQSVSIATGASLRDRLANLRPERVQGRPVSACGSISADELVKRLKGEWLDEGLMKISESLPLGSRIGDASLCERQSPPVLPGEAQAKPGLYIDTETTGLAGGSGTLAFLVGIAWVQQTHLQLTQYLITSFAAEAAMLREVQALLADGYRLVSYNGKSYDVPLLLTRFRMQGLGTSISAFEHLDLLHAVRRLFARRWDNCRLSTVEKRLLNFHREDDLSGSEAPEAWFAYLRGGYGEQLIKVVKHNRQDILSLPVIHQRLAQAVDQPRQYQVDFLGHARWLADIDEAWALSALAQSRDLLCDESNRLFAQLLRRAGRWPDAVAIWERLAAYGCADSVERLAKYHEHVSKDLQAAWQYCEQLSRSEADNHRRDRLYKKLHFG